MASNEENVVDENAVESEIASWCFNMSDHDMDVMLSQLELHNTGNRFLRAERLYRRLLGDYTAADFTRTAGDDSLQDIGLQRIVFQSILEQTTLPQRAQNLINQRERQHWASSSRYEPNTANPPIDAGDRALAATLGAIALNCYQNTITTVAPSGSAPASGADAPPPVIQNINNDNLDRLQWPVPPRTSGNEEAGAIHPNLAGLLDVPRASTATSGNIYRNFTGLLDVPRANTATSGNTYPNAAGLFDASRANTARANTMPTSATSTISSTSVRNTRSGPRINETSPHDIILCTMPDGSIRRLRRDIAIELAEMHAAIRYIESNLSDNSNSPNYDELQLALRQRRAADSTRATSTLMPPINQQLQNRVEFQDTFDLRYFERENPQLPTEAANFSQRNLPHPATRASGFQPRNPVPPQPARSESGGGGYSSYGPHIPEAATSSRPWNSLASESANRKQDIGKIVRSWKINFDGGPDSSIEEFLQRVNECRSLAHISDGDLLNAMTELMSGVALHWCRHLRARWLTWADFCADARRCYGVDPNYQKRLVIEAQTRTQGKGEPVRNYIACLLGMMDRFEVPWSMEEQLDLIYENLHPSLQLHIRRDHITDLVQLYEVTRRAETLVMQRNYKPPPSVDDSLMPEFSWKVAKPAKSNKPGVAAVTPAPPPDIVKIIEQCCQKFLQEQKALAASEKPKAAPQNQNKKGATKSAPAPAQKGQPSEQASADKPAKKAAIIPKSDKNKNREPGPRQSVLCWDCSWPGYVRTNCPECSVKEIGSE